MTTTAAATCAFCTEPTDEDDRVPHDSSSGVLHDGCRQQWRRQNGRCIGCGCGIRGGETCSPCTATVREDAR